MALRGNGLLKQLAWAASRPSAFASPSLPASFSPIASRCLSTGSLRVSSAVAPFRLSQIYPCSRMVSLNVSQRRFATGTGSGSHNLLAHMEQTANNNPTSATAQNAFYAALLRANMPAIVVERFQTGRYASNSACQATYTKALERLSTGGLAETGIGGGMAGYGDTQSSTLSNDTLQSVAQAIAARSRGGSAAMATRVSGAADQGSKRAPIYVITEESWGQAAFKWVKMIAYFCLVSYLVFVGIHLLIDTTGILRRATGVQAIEATTQKARFSDVQGCEEAKEELQELVSFLKDPTQFSKLGGKLPKGVLLTGPPGTGKTLLARAVAGEAGVPFYYMAGSEFDEIYVGVGAKRIRELFTQARAKAPAIIFIDELDAVGGKRSEKEASYHKQTLNQLLTELDGFDQDSGVIIIGATNFPKSLDKALTRPGRFDRNVHVDLPDVRGRLQILDFYLAKIKVGENVDSSVIARKTTGFSGADLENLVNQAAVRASRLAQSGVNLKDLDWAMDKIMMGPEKRSAVIKDVDKINTAYHEAGHTLVALYTPYAKAIHKTTIMPRGMALGLTHFLPEMDEVSVTKNQLLAHVDVAMGGKAAEVIVNGAGNETGGCSGDIQQATNQVINMIASYGMSKSLGDVDYTSDWTSEATKHAIEVEARQLIGEAYNRAHKLLLDKREELDMLAHALVKYETMDLEEMRAVLRGEELPNKLTSNPDGNIKVPPELAGIPGLTGQIPIQTSKTQMPSSDSTHRADVHGDGRSQE